MSETLNAELHSVLCSDADPSHTLQLSTALIGRLLDAHRCCLFLRHPESRLSRMTHEWVIDEKHRIDRGSNEWTVESDTLVEDDPMFAEALVQPEALYIDDVHTADPALVNGAFEEEHFGHRALVHAPLYVGDKMYGILEPCVFGEPRVWSTDDRAVVEQVQQRLAAVAATYVLDECGG